MSNYIDNLNYAINKAHIGLTSVNLLKTSDLYKQIIDEEIIEKIKDGIDNLAERSFDNIEQVRNSVAKDDLAFMSQVDNIIYKLTNGEQASDIKDEFIKNAALFPSVADDMHHLWQFKYKTATVLDQPIDNLYHTPNNQELSDQINYALNKANCCASLYTISQNIIDEINIAKDAELSDDKKHHLDIAKSSKDEFMQLNQLYKLGYNHPAIIDDFVVSETDAKLSELFDQVKIAGEIYSQLPSQDNISN